MGIGYRIRDGATVSNLLRKQYANDDIETIVRDIARKLCEDTRFSHTREYPIGSGMAALRGDLIIGRLTAAMYAVVYTAPFDHIEPDIQCDIDDCGLYEIEIIDWNHWWVWWYPIRYIAECPRYVMQKRQWVADVEFIDGEPLETGMIYTQYDGDVVL